MHDEEDDIESMSAEELFEATKQWLRDDMASLRARAHDDTASPVERHRAVQILLAYHRHFNRRTSESIEAHVRAAYGADGASPERQRLSVSLLIEFGLVTQFDLDHRPMDEVLTEVRQHLADQGFVDDTGLAG